jgi:hypothetical protein
MSAALMSRLDRIEKNVAQAVDILQQLAPAESRPVTPAAPAAPSPNKGRPRFGARAGR